MRRPFHRDAVFARQGQPVRQDGRPLKQSTDAGLAPAATTATDTELAAHTTRTDNPHAVTAAQAGAPTLAALAATQAELDAHEGRTDNPHAVTAAQAGAPTTATFNAHETRHRLGGADPLSVLTLGGYPGGTTNFLRADGSFASPPGGPAGADTQLQYNDAGALAGAASLVYDKATGNLGIGDAAPVSPVSVFSTSLANLAKFRRQQNVAGGAQFLVEKARDSAGAPAIVQDGDTIGVFAFQAHDGVQYMGIGQIRYVMDGTPGAGVVPSRIEFTTVPAGSGTAVTRLTIKNDGNIIVGAAASRHRNPVEQTTTSTGSVDNFSLTGARTFLRCNNASALTFTGFTVAGAAPQAGDEVIIESLSSTVRVQHQAAGSTAAHRVVTPSITGQLIAEDGRMHGIYDATTARWRFACVDPGRWIAVPYAAGNHSAAGAMTWTVDAGDIGTYHYRQRGLVLELSVYISGSSVGGTLDQYLLLAVPAPFTASPATIALASVDDVGAGQGGFVNANGSWVYILKLNTANWGASTNTTAVRGSLAMAIL